MESRKLDLESAHQILIAADQKLNFDRFNVHTIDKQTIKTLKETEEFLNEDLDNFLHESMSSEEGITKRNALMYAMSALFFKLGIYYAFKERDQEKAQFYFETCGNCYKAIKQPDLRTPNYAKILTLIGYAQTIDPTYHDNELFQIALSIFPEDGDDSMKEYRALALQYSGLMFHRLAIEHDKVKEFEKSAQCVDKAIELLSKAIEIQMDMLEKKPAIKIGLAESLHIYAVIMIRRGEITSAINKMEYFFDALAKLNEALQYETQFCQETKKPHFLRATTLQSLAKVEMYLGKPDRALNYLEDAEQTQYELFEKTNHPDIAKTLHFQGDVCVAKKDYAAACECYSEALQIKKQLKYTDNSIVQVTENSLRTTLKLLEAQNLEVALREYNYAYITLKSHYQNGFIQELQDRISFITMRLTAGKEQGMNFIKTQKEKVQESAIEQYRGPIFKGC